MGRAEPERDQGQGYEAAVRGAVFVRGRVQGVGFRWWTRARALELGLAGWARNTADGRVEVVAEGPRRAVQALLALLAPEGAAASGGRVPQRPGRVASVSEPRWEPPRGEKGFHER